MKQPLDRPAGFAGSLMRGGAVVGLLALGAGIAVMPVDRGAEPPVVRAQGANPFRLPDTLDAAKSAMIRETNYPVDEPTRLGNRVNIRNMTYSDGQIEAEVEVKWKNASGALIDGIRVNLEVKVRAGEEPALTAFRDVPQLTTSGVTRNGVARLKTPLRNDVGLMPGEYYIRTLVVVPAQEEAVRREMLGDPSIVNDAACAVAAEQEKQNFEAKKKIEAEKVEAARAEGKVYIPEEIPPARSPAKIREDTILLIGSGKNPVASNQFKLFVGTKLHWIDSGSLGDIAKIEDMVSAFTRWKNEEENCRLQMKGMKDGEEKEAYQKRLNLAITAKQVAVDALTFHGYPECKLAASDLVVRQNAEFNRIAVQDEIVAWEDKLVGNYLTLIRGDLMYWAWKASVLYGNPVLDAVRDGKLPWTGVTKLTYGKEDPERKIKKKEVTDMKTYREYLKERVTENVHGNPDTWPENGFKGDRNLERRGGLFSDSLLKVMLKDIEEFDLMKYVREERAEDGKIIYNIREDEWAKFEERFRTEMGHDERLQDEAVTKQLMAFSRDWSGIPMSTGDRIRALDFSPFYGIEPTRFPTAMASVKRAFDALAWLPMSYRYSIYTDVLKYTGRDLENALGSVQAFPHAARRRCVPLYNDYHNSRTGCESQLARYEFWFMHNYIHGYSEGAQRNLAKTGTRTRTTRDGRQVTEDYNRNEDIQKMKERLKTRNRRAAAAAGGGSTEGSTIKEIHDGDTPSQGGG